MIFYSLPFLLLFIISSLMLQYSQTIKQQRLVFLLANILFYAYYSLSFLGLLFGFIIICYLSGIAYGRKQKRIYIVLSVAVSLLILGIFKYYNFFVNSFCQAAGIEHDYSLNIILPLGISFYILQGLSYILDVAKGTIQAERDFIKLAAYLSFFPQITSGPIMKAHDFLPQLDMLHRIKKKNLYSGAQMILMGLTKKLVLANNIGVAVDAIYQAPGAYSSISILLAVLGYAMQIYFDFSGYSDMVIGIARIWDFDFGMNFNMPYLSANPSEFWRRWHISLSSWFRDYAYIPLGGGRKGRTKTIRNLLITMLLSGLWHGANWTYILWGFLHGIGLSLNRFWREIIGKAHAKKYKLPGILLNNLFVVLLWVIFRAESVEKAFEIYRGLFRFDGVTYINVYIVFSLILMIFGNLFSNHRNNGNAVAIDLNLDKFKNKIFIAFWLFIIVMFAYTGDTAFIYAQF